MKTTDPGTSRKVQVIEEARAWLNQCDNSEAMGPVIADVDRLATEAVREYQQHTTGSVHMHAHWTKMLRYTDGVRYLAEVCRAWWFVDLIASHPPSVLSRLARLGMRDFQVWRLGGRGYVPGIGGPNTRHGEDDALATAWTDTPGSSVRLARQSIPCTDFPEGLLPYVLWVENGVLMMPAER